MSHAHSKLPFRTPQARQSMEGKNTRQIKTLRSSDRQNVMETILTPQSSSTLVSPSAENWRERRKQRTGSRSFEQVTEGRLACDKQAMGENLGSISSGQNCPASLSRDIEDATQNRKHTRMTSNEGQTVQNPECFAQPVEAISSYDKRTQLARSLTRVFTELDLADVGQDFSLTEFVKEDLKDRAILWRQQSEKEELQIAQRRLQKYMQESVQKGFHTRVLFVDHEAGDSVVVLEGGTGFAKVPETQLTTNPDCIGTTLCLSEVTEPIIDNDDGQGKLQVDLPWCVCVRERLDLVPESGVSLVY